MKATVTYAMHASTTARCELPDDTTLLDLPILAEDRAAENSSTGLCHHCAAHIELNPDLGDAIQVVATMPDGREVILEPTTSIPRSEAGRYTDLGNGWSVSA